MALTEVAPPCYPGVDESYWVYPILTQSSLPSWPSNQTKVMLASPTNMWRSPCKH